MKAYRRLKNINFNFLLKWVDEVMTVCYESLNNMLNLAERIGAARFIQIIIECWNEFFLLTLLIMMLIRKKRDSSNTLTKSVEIPLTCELIVFYGATFLYNLFDILAILFIDAAGGISRIIISCSVFGYYAVGGFMTVFYLQVIKNHIAQKLKMRQLKNWIFGFQLLQIPLFLMLAATPFTGLLYRIASTNHYERAIGYNIWQAVTILTFVFIGAVVITQWRRINRYLKEIIITATALPIVGISFGIFIPLSLNNITVAVTALILFLIYERNKTTIIIKRTHELETVKAELAENRLTMMLAQIKPHFIYNSMNAIMELCYIEPELAADTIAHFSDYLRRKLEAFDSSELTWFDEELGLIKEYLSIEYADHNKVFRVKYDIACTDFRLPALTVQPLIENAVKHGIDRYSDDSLVQLITCEDEQNICIKVTDNGTAEKGDDSLFADSRGIGLSNVAKRLQLLCGGDIVVTQNENGTSAVITIPKLKQEEQTNAHSYSR